MKIKDLSQKKRVSDRLKRIEWQVRWVIQMIEDEASVREIVQQISAIRSAMSQAANEELLCAIERTTEKKSPLDDKERDEIRSLLKLIR
jgi:DNA-binding FrmR family transcriptional regulator